MLEERSAPAIFPTVRSDPPAQGSAVPETLLATPGSTEATAVAILVMGKPGEVASPQEGTVINSAIFTSGSPHVFQ